MPDDLPPPSSPTAPRSGLARLVVAEGISVAGDWVLNTAASIAVFHRTGSTTAVSLLLGLALVPTVLVAPLAGAMADRHDRRSIMVLADLLSGLTLTLAALTAAAGFDLAATYLAVFALAVLAAYRRPASEAIRPAISGQALLGRANSMVQTATRLGMIGGPAAAGFLMSAGGLELALVVDAISFGTSAALIVAIPKVPMLQVPRPSSGMSAAMDGLRFTHGNRGVRTTVAAIGVVMLAAPVVNAGTIALVRNELGEPESRYGLLLASEGAGALALALLFAWLSARVPMLGSGVAGLVATGASTIIVGAAPSIVLAAAGMALMGIGVVTFQICFTSYLQRETPDQFRGRVMSLASMTAALAGLVGFAGAGPLVDLIGVRQAFWLAGGLIVLTAVPVSTLAWSMRKTPAAGTIDTSFT